MTELVLTTFDWVPDLPRGYVRDLRIRWALEEAGLPYRVESTPFRGRGSDHFAHQPFGQVPWLTDGDTSIFESGAIIIYLGNLSTRLLPAGAKSRAKVITWVFAALNSVEMPAVPWSLYKFSNDTVSSPGRTQLEGWLDSRLDHMETVLSDRVWLADSFSIADILMADVLRFVDRFDALSTRPVSRAYVARATERPAFRKAHADQIAHFAATD